MIHILFLLLLSGPTLYWNKSYRLDKNIPENLSGESRDAIARLSKWSREHDYSFSLNNDQSVLYISQKQRKNDLKLIEQGLDFLRENYTPPAWTDENGDLTTRRLNFEGVPLETEIITLVRCETQDDYEAVLDVMAKRFSYLSASASAAKKGSGALFTKPLFGVWITSAGEMFSPDNEMIHRLAQLYMARTFEEQPYWARVGIGWHTEINVLKTVRCFPYYGAHFVPEQHTAGFDSRLKNV